MVLFYLHAQHVWSTQELIHSRVEYTWSPMTVTFTTQLSCVFGCLDPSCVHVCDDVQTPCLLASCFVHKTDVDGYFEPSHHALTLTNHGIDPNWSDAPHRKFKVEVRGHGAWTCRDLLVCVGGPVPFVVEVPWKLILYTYIHSAH